MEGADRPFFRLCRQAGVNRCVLALTESRVPLDAHSLAVVVRARAEKERFEKYTADLIWLLVKSKGDIDLPAPSELSKPKKKEKSGAEIIADVLRKMRE